MGSERRGGEGGEAGAADYRDRNGRTSPDGPGGYGGRHDFVIELDEWKVGLDLADPAKQHHCKRRENLPD